MVEEATLTEFKDGRVHLRVASDLMTAAVGVREDIRQLIGRVWGRSVQVEFSCVEVAETVQSVEQEAPAAPTMTVANATEHPLIARAVELLGAKVVGVYPRQR